MNQRKRWKIGWWRRFSAGAVALLLVIAVLPWYLLAKTESVVSTRKEEGGYTSINWEKSAFLPEDNYQVLNMETHRTNEGLIAYCLQAMVSNPTNEAISYGEGRASAVFSKEAMEAVKHIMMNGYPMNQEMWDLPERAQQEATQIAIWYVMSYFSQEGTGPKGAPSSFQVIVDEDCIRNATSHDAVGMIRQLIQCGLSGQDKFAHFLELEEYHVREENGIFTIDYQLKQGNLDRIEGNIAGIQGDYTLHLDGKELICKEGNFSFAGTGNEIKTLAIQTDAYPNKKQKIQLSLTGYDHRNEAGIFFLEPSGNYQKMAGVRVTDQRAVTASWDRDLPDYVPDDTILEVVKKDSENGTLLEGAVFQVYRVEDILKENKWQELPVESDGTGNYAVKKEHLEKCTPVEIGEEGAVTMVTGKDGICRTKPLAFAEYLLVETETPKGYLTAAPQFIRFSGKGEEMVTVTVYDQLFRTALHIQKKDAVTGADICQSGIAYELLSEEKEAISFEEMTYTTNEDGLLIISQELPSGVYYLREKKAPAGYALEQEDIKVEISCGQVAVTQRGETNYAKIRQEIRDRKYHYTAEFSVEDDPIILEIAKTHPKGEGNLAGAALELTAKEDIFGADGSLYYEAGELVHVWVSEQDSEFFYGIPAGIYELTELEAPTGYQLAKPKKVEVLETPELQQVELENEWQKKHLQLTKTGPAGEPLSEVIYELQYGMDVKDANGEIIFRKGESVPDGEGNPICLSTDGEGKAAVSDLFGWYYDEKGNAVKELTYQLQELATKEGYVLEKEPYVLDEKDWKEEDFSWTVTLENQGQKGCIQVTKFGSYPIYEKTYASEYGEIYSEEQERILLAGAEFTLYEDEACEKPVEVIVTGKDGIGRSSKLPVGIYYMKETKTPKGYLPAEEVIFCEIKGDRMGEALVKDTFVEVVNEPCQVVISFEKRGRVKNAEGEWEWFPLADAVFGLYRNEKLLATALSQEDGLVAFSGNYPEGTYQIAELLAPEGFVSLERPVEIYIEPGNEPLEMRLDSENFENTAVMGKLTLEKVNEDQQSIPEVEFTLTNRETGERWIGITDEDGMYEWRNLPAGYRDENGAFIYYHYDLEETKTPEGYIGMEGTEEFVFSQENNGQAVVAIRTIIENKNASVPLILGHAMIPWEVTSILAGVAAVAGTALYFKKKR